MVEALILIMIVQEADKYFPASPWELISRSSASLRLSKTWRMGSHIRKAFGHGRQDIEEWEVQRGVHAESIRIRAVTPDETFDRGLVIVDLPERKNPFPDAQERIPGSHWQKVSTMAGATYFTVSIRKASTSKVAIR